MVKILLTFERIKLLLWRKKFRFFLVKIYFDGIVL